MERIGVTATSEEDWMSSLPEKLWDVPLTNLSIPVRHKELWPAIPYLWANKPNAEELIQYLEWQKKLGRPEGFFIAGLNLTTDRCFIGSHPRMSLRTLTVENWDCVRRWLEDQKPGAASSSMNIIAGDFIGPIPFCSIVIALNRLL
ncbi:PI-PLC X domain-containing protein 1 [Triplophysa tibetana]|uniref:PI-PLC X domain-containing protein 1 n=1 Tax=Triplophysa tibetana TaxID=1572043 RepID=A0A5A9NTZ7_9TELE|nr:PI-PLC X domain-containing protein 1 [Triplophysa tibetana]